MPDVLDNPFRDRGMPGLTQMPAFDPEPVARLLAQCPAHCVSPLLDLDGIARRIGCGHLAVKDERRRMGLGSFKALGAAYAIAAAAAEAGPPWETSLEGRTYIAASAGNHGLSVASGARLFGARSVIYLSRTVPEPFAERLRSKGAEVVRAGATYEESMAAAEAAARTEGVLLSDSAWPGYMEQPFRVMEGYLQLAAEAVEQMDAPPTHVVLQAGVGGLAAAVAAYARVAWGEAPVIVVVEPAFAPGLFESIRAGRLVTADGPVSNMGRLDCKTPSMIALAGLARDADLFATITEAEASEAVAVLAEAGIATTPSGAAGIAAVLGGIPGVGSGSRVLAILSEGPENA